MKFYVTFKCKDDKELFISPPGKIGLDMIDILREDDKELKDLDLSKFNSNISCPSAHYQLLIYLSEETARKSGLFGGRQNITVTIPSYSFTKYLKYECNKNYSNLNIIKEKRPIKGLKLVYPFLYEYTKVYEIDNRDILNVSISYNIDKKTILKDWIKSGYKLEWNPEKNI